MNDKENRKYNACKTNLKFILVSIQLYERNSYLLNFKYKV